MAGTANSSDMSFWAHLDDLRRVLFKMALVLAVFMAVFFIYMPWLFDNVILAPCHGDFFLYRLFAGVTAAIPGLEHFSTDDFSVNLINFNLTAQFFTHLSTSFWLSLVFSFPILLYLLWTFVRPALYPNEIKGARTAFSLGAIMFYIGLAVGYFLVFPITLRFLYTYQLSGAITNSLSLDSYMDNFMMLNLIMGITFELPLLAWALSSIGLLRRQFFKRYRRHAIVVLLILAAVITPTGDPFTLMIVFLPIYLLYEASAIIVKKE